jgi:hypothetical protein
MLLHLLTAGFGTKRTYPRRLLFVRFRGEADVPRGILTIMSDANDPKRR